MPSAFMMIPCPEFWDAMETIAFNVQKTSGTNKSVNAVKNALAKESSPNTGIIDRLLELDEVKIGTIRRRFWLARWLDKAADTVQKIFGGSSQ